YLIKIAPGGYIEPGGFDLKDYVDIEGSGQDTTTLTCECGTANGPTTDGTSAVLRATGTNLHSEVRNLTIQNTGDGAFSTGIWTDEADHVVIRDVTISATGGSNTSVGMFMQSSTASQAVTDVTAIAGGGVTAIGVEIKQSEGTLTGGTAMATS